MLTNLFNAPPATAEPSVAPAASSEPSILPDEYATLVSSEPLPQDATEQPMTSAVEAHAHAAADSVIESTVLDLDAAIDAPTEPEPEPGTTAYALAQHRRWLASCGAQGVRADFTAASLRGADLHGADLRDAILRRADLNGADLSLADLRGANLAHADLRKTILLGAQLRDAGLQGVLLEGAIGLVAGQLAATNMFGASVDRYIPMAHYEIMKLADRFSRTARALFFATLASCALSVMLVAGATDVQLIRKDSLIPLPFAAGLLPADAFLLIAPLVLLALYVAFHTYLLLEWEQLAQLPQVFPDGFHVDRKGAWLLSSLIRPHCRWLAGDGLPLSPLLRVILAASAYWIVPAALLLFWARYLTRLHIHATIYHVALVVGTGMLAIFLPSYAARIFRPHQPNAKQDSSPKSFRRILHRGALPSAFGALLVLLSFGTVYGVPHDCDVSVVPSTDMRRWAPRALWLVGYDPFPDLAEAVISAKPAKWDGEDVAAVRGARLDGFSLRHAQAYRSFFVKAGLRDAEMDHADLSESDFRGANLRHAGMRFADLSGARFNGASMEGALLHNARLVRADLRDANISFSFLNSAVLIDATLTGANLFGADLRGASLLGAHMQKADLREADLQEARLDQADLRGAYLWSAKLARAQLHDTQLQNAILIEADLRGAILRGANLEGTVLRGANLDGADLRGASGLTPSQLCTIASRHQMLLDESLRRSADEACATLAPRPSP